MAKALEAFRTISEVADELEVPKHVLRFWEAKFSQIRPMKRGGGRRYYRPEDLDLLRGIRSLLHQEGYTIKGVQKILREQGVDAVKDRSRAGNSSDTAPASTTDQAASSASTETSATTGAARRGTGAAQSSRKPSKGGAAAIAPLDAEPPMRIDPTLRAHLKALKGELEACRALLGGKSARKSARTGGSRTPPRHGRAGSDR
jgi:DNA-binding transcriptional MerR regulator